MNGEYQEGEKQQEIQVTVRFKVKHNPGIDSHLKQLCLSHFPVKGVPIRLEDDKLVIEI